MPRTFRFAFLSAALVAAVTAAGLALTARAGRAQQFPPPNEEPRPPELCCGQLSPGGRTIGGPAVETLQPFGGENDYQTNLLRSAQPVSMCATLGNLNDPASDSGHMLVFVSEQGGSGRNIFNPFPGPPADAVPVHPGRTVVACGYGKFVGVSCLTSSTHCRYRWRIDLQHDGPGVQVRSPR